MKRAFTLIELLIVISIISMLSSIVIATTTSAQAKGRDAKRVQQIRQIDLATRLYIDTLGHAPLADMGCGVSSGPVSEEDARDCMFSSSDSSWSTFATALVTAGVISEVPVDPCGSQCDSLSGYDVGYTYIAPLAMQYFCLDEGTGCVATDESYQLYAPLEQVDLVAGNEGNSSSGYYSLSVPGSDITPPSVPQNFQLIATPQGESTYLQFSWDTSTDTGGSGLAGYNIYNSLIPGSPHGVTTNSFEQTLYFTDGQICFWVTAYDGASNASSASVQQCYDF